MVTTAQRVGSWALSTARQLAADQAGQPFSAINNRYDLLTMYYHNEMYDSANRAVQLLKSQGGIYRNIRPVLNPIRRAADFYPANVYPGAMTPDGLPLPDGTPCCVPFASDTDDELRLAMIQALMWGNWGSERDPVILNLAVLGDAFGEIEVDYERGIVQPKFLHPGIVVDIEWNGSGDIIMYRLERQQTDKLTKLSYRWGKIVDKERITFLRNDEPFSYDGQPAVQDNPWGFVPAAWCQFRNVGGQHGASIVDGVKSKIDELNGSLSAVHDLIQRFVNQGVVIAADGGQTKFEAAMANKKTTGATDERVNPQAGRQESNYTFVPRDTVFFKPIEDLGLGPANPHIHDLITEIENDLPEATLEAKIQAFAQPPSGRALRMMFGGVESRVNRVQGNADHMLIKLMQMSVSIGGHLVNNRTFGFHHALTEQQRRFIPFNLESYKRGELAVTLLPRPLFPDTTIEKAETARARESIETATGLRETGYDDAEIAALLEERLKAHAPEMAVLWAQAGMPLPAILREIGKTPAEIAAVMADKEANAERARAAFDAGEAIEPGDEEDVA